MSILLITTGGTIGAAAYPNPDNPPVNVPMPSKGEDFVRDAVMRDFPGIVTRCISLEPRDSKHIDRAYRETLVKTVAVAPERFILITHGTDALLKTAEFFFQYHAMTKALAGRFIVLTGSMVPLANGPDSDGYLTVKFSIDRLKAMAGERGFGVYIVLCDYDDPEAGTGAWKPRLYPFAPGRYQKVYMPDGRYNRLKRLK